MSNTPKNPINPLLEPLQGTQPHQNYFVGKNPLILGGVELEKAGIERTTPLRAIRRHCLSCCGFNRAEVRRCVATRCPLWPLRMGGNPFHRKGQKNG